MSRFKFVIRGGAFSTQELDRAIQRDAVVAAHYADIDPARVKTVAAEAGRKVYVSYRIGDQVLWTRNRVALKAGETLLSDRKHEARGRCGNRISEVALKPTSLDEPDEQDLDMAEPEEGNSQALAGSREKSPKQGATDGRPFFLVPDLFVLPEFSGEHPFSTPSSHRAHSHRTHYPLFLGPVPPSPGNLSPAVIVSGLPGGRRYQVLSD